MQILLGFILGALVPFLVQAWVFFDRDQKEKEKRRAYLNILNNDLKGYYQKLFFGEFPYYSGDVLHVLTNYKDFNTSNKHAMWTDLMKYEVFYKNLEIFEKINSIVHKIEILNAKMRIIIPERFSMNAASIDVHDYRDIMDEIRNLYVTPKSNNTPYEETELGNFLIKVI